MPDAATTTSPEKSTKPAKRKPRAGASGRKDSYYGKPEDFVIVGYDTDDREEHPLYDPERLQLELDEALVRNIEHYGVKVPIACRKNGNRVEVINGRRRVLHAREANRRLRARGEPPIVILFNLERYSSEKFLIGSMRVMNEYAHIDTPLTRARHAGVMWQRGASDEDIKITFGISDSTVAVWKNLLDLDPKVHKRIEEGKIGAIAAAKLADLPRVEQVERCDTMIAEGMTTAAEATQVVKGAKNGKKVTREDVSKPPSKAVLKKLVKALEADDDHDVDVSDEFVRGVKFVLGQIKPSAIKNMLTALQRAGYKG